LCGHRRPGLQIARFAMRGDRTLILLVFAAPVPLEAPGPEAQHAVLRERFAHAGWECAAILAAMERSDALYFDKVSQIETRRWSRGRVALVGDAACAPSLLAGQGSALAMLGAYVLAGEIARAPDHRQAFAAYEQRLRAFMEHKQRNARRFASQFVPGSELGLLVRRWITRVMSIPGVATLALGRSLRDRLDLPDYSFPGR
jgi:2-polyprenyl-6-methoxyphenol hydroxylase-like FAD-dependent oxidoreductase